MTPIKENNALFAINRVVNGSTRGEVEEEEEEEA